MSRWTDELENIHNTCLWVHIYHQDDCACVIARHLSLGTFESRATFLEDAIVEVWGQIKLAIAIPEGT